MRFTPKQVYWKVEMALKEQRREHAITEWVLTAAGFLIGWVAGIASVQLGWVKF